MSSGKREAPGSGMGTVNDGKGTYWYLNDDNGRGTGSGTVTLQR